MEPNEVLKQYIDLCNSQSGFLQYSLANNAILEWFGRTIRGRHKIYHYFRYDMCQQYEHNFKDAHTCEPIESKSTHFETKNIVNDDSVKETITEIKRNISETTPIRLNNISPELPRLNRGLKFIHDTDDEELNELGLSTIRDSITPPPLPNIDEPLPKRIKHSNSIDNKLLNIEEFIDKSKINVDNKNLNNSNNKIIPVSNECNEIKYSPLMYLEVNGKLRILNRIKHRGIHTPPTTNHLISTETTYTDLNNSNHITTNTSSYWDREVKLKISYRIRLLNNQIEFALIIYEHIARKATTKRNLLTEFDETINDKNELSNKKETLSKITKDDNSPMESRRKKPLKRLLRLF